MAFAPIVKSFSDKYNWEVLAISTSGEKHSLFERSVQDNGLSAYWNVDIYPSLFAVNPKTGHVIPIARGMISVEEMEWRRESSLSQRMKRMSKYLFLLSVLIFSNSYAGIGRDLEGFFNSLGAVTNGTSPGVYHDQSGGFYNGGGLSLRNRAKNTQIATVQLPNFKAGCGGIDMFTGGFSYISSAELVNALKSIGSSAVSYGFMLAMKTFAPAVQSVMAELQDMASKINQSNINSCETAATLLGGVGSSSGMFKDWAAARQGCGAGSSQSGVMARKGSVEGYKNILAEEFNIAWEVLKKNNYIMSDRELAELCMTISGTITAISFSENKRFGKQ